MKMYKSTRHKGVKIPSPKDLNIGDHINFFEFFFKVEEKKMTSLLFCDDSIRTVTQTSIPYEGLISKNDK